MGLESWREYCDCVECYQVYIVLSKDINEITKEEFDYISEIELPTGQEFTEEVKKKFEEVKKHFEGKDEKQIVQAPIQQTTTQQSNSHTDNTANWNNKGQSRGYKQYDSGYNRKQSNKSPYKNR